MVALGLEVGGIVGVVLSAGFVYFEVGRFATPQVPKSRFDEGKAIAAYVVGLFVGVPLALVWIFFMVAVGSGGWISAIVDVVLLVAGADIAQTALLRTHFFGFTPADPFYALAARAGIGGLLTVGTLAVYSWSSVNPLGLGLALVQSVALVSIQVAAGLRGLLPAPTAYSVLRQRLASFVLLIVLYVLTSSGGFYGTTYGLVGAAIAIGGAVFLYWDARPTVLAPYRSRTATTARPEASPFNRRAPGDGKRKLP